MLVYERPPRLKTDTICTPIYNDTDYFRNTELLSLRQKLCARTLVNQKLLVLKHFAVGDILLLTKSTVKFAAGKNSAFETISWSMYGYLGEAYLLRSHITYSPPYLICDSFHVPSFIL